MIRIPPLETTVACEDTWCGFKRVIKYTQGNGHREYAQAQQIAEAHHRETRHTVRVEQGRTEIFWDNGEDNG